MVHPRSNNSSQTLTKGPGEDGRRGTRTLQSACALIERAAQHSEEGAIAFDDHGDCVWVNQAALHMLGLTDATLIVSRLNLRRHALLEEGSQPSEIERAFHGEAVGLSSFGYGLPGVECNGDGDIKLGCYTRLLPLVDDSGRVARLYVFHQATSDRKAIGPSDGGQDPEVLLTHSVQTAGLIVRRVTHDFNNLIAVVRGYAAVLQGNPQLPEDSQQLASFIELAGAELADLTDRLARFSDPPPHDPTKLNLNRVVNEFLSKKWSILPEGVDLQIALAEPLPDLMGDTAQLREACGHIWQNAIDAMPHGGELVWQTSASPDLESTYSNKGSQGFSRYVRLQISDSGEGMDGETLTNIFAPFFSTRAGKGRGLGATAVYQIVKAHGGYVEVSSGVGAGSCINLYLPSSSEGEDQPSHEAGATHGARGPLLLLVDDDEMVRLTIQRILDHLGYRSIVVGSGEEALAIYEQSGSEIAAVILDITMPGLGGIETFRRLRSMNSQVKIIVCSGDPLTPAIRDLESEGMSYLITKPFQSEELAQAIQQTIG